MNYLQIKIQQGQDEHKAGGLSFRVEGTETITFAHYSGGLKIGEREFTLPDLVRTDVVAPSPVEVDE